MIVAYRLQLLWVEGKCVSIVAKVQEKCVSIVAKVQGKCVSIVAKVCAQGGVVHINLSNDLGI